MRVNDDGQLVVPRDVCRMLGFDDEAEIVAEVEGDCLRLRKAVVAPAGARSRGDAFVDRISGRGSVPWTTDEIMELTRGESDLFPHR